MYGFGEKKTPTSFIAACDKFIYTEVLRKSGEDPNLPTPARRDLFGDKSRLRHQLIDAVESCTDESGWAHLGAVGNVMANHVPDSILDITDSRISLRLSKLRVSSISEAPETKVQIHFS